jgi:hypothetical protein
MLNLINSDVFKTITLFFKCILILIFLGIILPNLFDYIIISFIIKSKFHGNSVLVYNILSDNKQIIYNYIYLFKLTISR